MPKTVSTYNTPYPSMGRGFKEHVKTGNCMEEYSVQPYNLAFGDYTIWLKWIIFRFKLQGLM